ncbi:hypothetical protein MKW94_014672 [Papaver nudicaule]|uniref:Galactose oxidase n=1 Tax=Papaver nudicaule TaxID=74823 RepID=A0AA41SA68_PAPNU|nr:hypothetical protein [Papaver nudicaule]
MEDQNGLVVPRWYASNHILPDGKIIVVGGRAQFSYEFILKSTSKSDFKVYELPFLKDTTDDVENNLYPFLHLSTDGNLFIFANNRSILFGYINNRVVRDDYPVMPGEVSRNYPSTGSSVLLPLKLGLINSSIGAPDAEVFICGGSAPNSFTTASNGRFLSATKTYGRLMITVEQPKWEMEEMPIERVMGDMILLPTGSAGWYLAREPALNPVLYQPYSRKFEVMKPSKIARMYHSTAILITDGRNYNFIELFPTELSVEVFSPPYLSSRARPQIIWAEPETGLSYGQSFSIGFDSTENGELESAYVTMVAPSFNTHSFSMNQRMMVLEINQIYQVFGTSYVIDCFAPATPYLHHQVIIFFLWYIMGFLAGGNGFISVNTI